MNIKFNPIKNLEGSGSREAKTIEKFNEYITANNIEITSEDQIKEIIGNRKTKVSMPGVDVEEVIKLMKSKGMIDKVKETKKEVRLEDIPITKTESEKVIGLKVVDDPELARIFRENQEFEELRKNVFENPDEIDIILSKALLLRQERIIENEKYYYGFSTLIPGGLATIKNDIESLNEIKKKIQESNDIYNNQKYKVSTIVERAVAYGVSELGWFGSRMSIEPTSQFDDIKRGVDGVLEIQNPNKNNSFLGLGIDVTTSGIKSENYRNKVFKIVRAMRQGYETKIKYFKNHEGEMMEEFAVPKIVLSFDTPGVQSLVRMIKSSDNQKMKEDFKTSPQKFVVLNQTIAQCRVLGEEAQACENPIAGEYFEAKEAFEGIVKELAIDNSETQKKMDAENQEKMYQSIKRMVGEFDYAEELENAA